jgi:mRNA interferase RelE/StbE
VVILTLLSFFWFGYVSSEHTLPPAAESVCGLVDFSERSGYRLARMRFEILLAPEAIEDLRRLEPDIRTGVQAAIELHLRHEPTKVSRSRIKRLRGLTKPQFRLRVGTVRVFYDVVGAEVQVLAAVEKGSAAEWLAELGEQDEKGSSLGRKGRPLKVSSPGRRRGDRNHPSR